MSLADFAENNTGRGLIYALEGIEHQMRLANRIALAQFANAYFGHYASPVGEWAGALFDYGEAVGDNIKIKPDIMLALGLSTTQTVDSEEAK